MTPEETPIVDIVHLIPLQRGESVLPIPHHIAEELNLHGGEEVEVMVEGERIVITPMRKVPVV